MEQLSATKSRFEDIESKLTLSFSYLPAKMAEILNAINKPAIDDAIRARALKIYSHHNQKCAVDFIDYLRRKFPSEYILSN